MAQKTNKTERERQQRNRQKNKYKRKREIHVKSIESPLSTIESIALSLFFDAMCVCVLVISLSILEFELWLRRSTSIEVGEIIAN